jgi:hypothetical protein
MLMELFSPPNVLNWEYSDFYLLCILLDKGFSSLDLNNNYLWLTLKLLRWNTLQITTLDPLPEQRLKWWLTMSHLWLEPFAMHAFVPCPQFFCLLKPTASVCTKFHCFSFSCWWPLVRVHLIECLNVSPKAYIPSHRSAPKTLYKEYCFYVNADLLRLDHDHSWCH